MRYFNEYYSYYWYRDDAFDKRNVCFLVLAAVVMKADGFKINRTELNFMKQLYLKLCGERIAKAYILKLRDILEEEAYDMEYTFELFRTYADYIDRKAAAESLFELASIDGEIGVSEFIALWDIVRELGLDECDKLPLLNRYSSRITRRVVFKYEWGELCYRIVDSEDNKTANVSKEDTIVKKAFKQLEINENATEAQVKEAYHKMAKKFHPDCHNDSQKGLCEEKMKEINEAYKTIMEHRKNNSRRA